MAKGKRLGDSKPTRIEIAISPEDKAIIDKMANLKKLLGDKETVSDMVRAYLLKTAKRYLEDHKDLIERLAKRTQRDLTSFTPSINDDPGEEEQSSEPIEEIIEETPSADPEPETTAEIIPEEETKPEPERLQDHQSSKLTVRYKEKIGRVRKWVRVEITPIYVSPERQREIKNFIYSLLDNYPYGLWIEVIREESSKVYGADWFKIQEVMTVILNDPQLIYEPNKDKIPSGIQYKNR